MAQSVSQSINQSTNQTINQSIAQSVSQSMNQPTNQCFYFLFLFYRAYHPSIFIKKHLLSSIQMVKQDRFSHVSRIFPMIFLSFLLFPPGAFDILSGFWGDVPHISPGRSPAQVHAH